MTPKAFFRMTPKDILRKIKNRCIRKQYADWYKKSFDFRGELKVNNIFDYNYVIRERLPRQNEVYYGNMMYGLGQILREYSGYQGKLYCASEHGTPTERFDNTMEYRDNSMPLLLVHSSRRREFLSDKTDKLIIPCGPSFMPYGKPIYSEFAINATKKSLGKTLVVYPQHNNDTSEFVDFDKNNQRFIKYVDGIKKQGNFKSVIVSLYYIDIERGVHRSYEEKGWIVMSAGKNISYDFPDCFMTILSLADFVIAQSITGIAFCAYKRIPGIFYPGNRQMINEKGGYCEDAWTIDGKSWLKKTEDDLLRLFGEYVETLTEEQYAWCNNLWGYSETKTSEEMNLIFQFAREIRKKADRIDVIEKIARKQKYELIKSYIDDAIAVYKKNH